jgi:hypothetical protein
VQTPPVVVTAPQPPVVSAPPSVIAPTISGRLAEASARVERAQQLHESITRRLRAVDEQMDKHARQPAPGLPSSGQTELSRLRNMTRDTQAIRQAFIASLVFGTPKGLEP